jgi:hypothetical protein
MQDVDRPADVQPLAEPLGACCPRVEVQALRLVPRLERLHWIPRNYRRARHLGNEPAVRLPEFERAVRLSIDVVTLFVDRTMVPPAEHRQVRERRRTTLRPVADVMSLAEANVATRKAATSVAVVQDSPQRWRNRASPSGHLHDTPILIVAHHDAARVARESATRFL